MPPYSASPRIHGAAAETIGGTAAAVNAQLAGGGREGQGDLSGEILGVQCRAGSRANASRSSTVLSVPGNGRRFCAVQRG